MVVANAAPMECTDGQVQHSAHFESINRITHLLSNPEINVYNDNLNYPIGNKKNNRA
jgi:hypothetical protein